VQHGQALGGEHPLQRPGVMALSQDDQPRFAMIMGNQRRQQIDKTQSTGVTTTETASEARMETM
jgi:hypothetical protein